MFEMMVNIRPNLYPSWPEPGLGQVSVDEHQRLTREVLVIDQRQQGNCGFSNKGLHPLLFEVKHRDLKLLRPQVPVQVWVHGDRVGLDIVELRVAAVMDSGRGMVREAVELVNHVWTRQLGVGGAKVRAAPNGDEELVPAVSHWRQQLSHKQKKKWRTVLVYGGSKVTN